MVGHLSATDVAFAMNAVMQGVFCGIWLLGSLVIGDVRRAALHWSAFAGLSTLSFLVLIVALHQPVPLPAEYLRALGNLFGLAAMLALHRGIRLFIDASPWTGTHAFAFVVVLGVSWLGLSPEHATLLGLVVGRILADLRYRSRHDGLTGLLNRRAMEEILLAQMQRSRRTGESFTVLMLDLDHFKNINDQHGHATGDRALKHTAAALRSELREVDAIGRFGGEEFLIVMPGATADAARPVAERLRAALVTDAPRVDGAPLPLSASIGIAQWHERGEEPSRLLMRADAALYQAKQRGRDCVVVDAPEREPTTPLAGGE